MPTRNRPRPERLVILLLAGLIAALAAASALASSDPRPSGALRIVTTGAMWQTDPALAYITSAWELEYATCAKLVNYPDAPPPEGSRLVPEIAAAMPTISPDGRTYTFQIRNDYAFSPPASGVVTAQSMKYTFERTLAPDHGLAGDPVLRQHRRRRRVQQRAAERDHGHRRPGKHAHVQADRAAGAIPQRCSRCRSRAPCLRACRRSSSSAPIPSAGPYYISQRQYPDTIVASRNPNYTGPRPHWFDSIEYTFNVNEQEVLQRVLSGMSDYSALARSRSRRRARRPIRP